VKVLAKENNIHIRIEICKDETSGELKLMTYFDTSAPNFWKDEEGYFWNPTIEERDFLNEAFEFMPSQNQVLGSPMERREEKFAAPKPQVTVTKEFKKSWEKPPSLEKKDLKKPVDKPVMEKEAVFEVTEESTQEEPKSINMKEEDDGTITKADDAAIERALKKEVDEDKTIKEVDEQTIIEKVLSQKKKGKWSKNP